jgi:hypothetical protein
MVVWAKIAMYKRKAEIKKKKICTDRAEGAARRRTDYIEREVRHI